jgi:ornithine cyclodeaminase/alanine dehydrogenase-like protein (mu-crystallin family)
MRPDYRVIKRQEIAEVLDIESLIEPMAHAFKAVSSGRSLLAVEVLHPTPGSDIHIKSAIEQGADIFVVKTAGWSAHNEKNGLAANSGMITVFDAKSCYPLAILQDGHLISDLRTAASGALAAQTLANTKVSQVGLLGAGEQAFLQVMALCQVRSPESISIWNRSQDKAYLLAQRLQANLEKRLPGLNIQVKPKVQQVVEQADILICATAAKQALVQPGWLKPGLHITSVGADDSTKCELATACLSLADIVVVDSREFCSKFGNIHRAMQQGFCPATKPLIELGEILNGDHPGRKSIEQITIASLVGLGAQDLAVVSVLQKRLRF